MMPHGRESRGDFSKCEGIQLFDQVNVKRVLSYHCGVAILQPSEMEVVSHLIALSLICHDLVNWLLLLFID